MDLTKKAKIALGSAGAGILALAVALGIWQPWKQPDADQPEEPNQLQGEVLPPAGEEEEGPTLTVGGEKIPGIIFEGDGWKIFVPEEWRVEETEWGSTRISHEVGTFVEVQRGVGSAYEGNFVSAVPGQFNDRDYLVRTFYSGSGAESWQVSCHAAADSWSTDQKLLTAMVRTMTVGEEMLFSGLSPLASEPDWQIVDGDTLLWMDKDAYIVDDVAEEDVVTRMLAWDKDTKANFTGQYRMDDLVWAGSYTCLPDREYVDVFRTSVWYEIAPGKEENILLDGNMSIEDGWVSEGFPLCVVVYHDGSAVEEVRVMFTNLTDPGRAQFVIDNLLDKAE